MNGLPSEKRDRFVTVGVFLAALIVLFHRLLLGEVLYWGLPSLQFYPWREFGFSEVLAGRLPLWNPYNGAGAPLLANYQSALLYPPHWLHLLIPDPRLMGWIGIGHALGAALGMWRFAGRLGAAPLGRGIATLAFPLSTALITRLGTIPMLEVAAWLPWLMLCVEGVLSEETPQTRLSAWCGLALSAAFMLLAGHAQWAFYGLLLAGGYALWRTPLERRPLRRLTLCGGAVALAVGIAGAQLLPTAELQRLSQRAEGVTEAFALNFSFSPFQIFTLLYPDFYGNPGKGVYKIGGAFFEVAAYIGVFPMLLILVIGWRTMWRTVWRGGRRPKQAAGDGKDALRLFFGGVAALSFLLALGQFTPAFPFLYRHVPTFSLFQAPARWLLLTVFALVMIAALAPLKGGRRVRFWGRLGVVLGLGMALISLIAASLAALSGFAADIAMGVFGLGAAVAVGSLVFVAQPLPAAPEQAQQRWRWGVLVLLAVDLVWANWGANPTTAAAFYSPRPNTSEGRGVWLEADIRATQFDTYLRLDNYSAVSAAESLDAYRGAGLPNLNLLDRHPLLNNFDPLRPSWHETFMAQFNDPAQREQLEPLAGLGGERLWIVPRGNPTEDRLPPVGYGSAAIITETPLALTITADSPDGGWLILADTDYPGWAAWVDDHPTPIQRANGAFRAVALPAGRHTVLFRYESRPFQVGGILSGTALAVLIVVWAVGRLMIRRTP